MSERGQTGADEFFLTKPAGFSLALGGPLYQLWRGTRLAGETLQLLRRRIIALAMPAWMPLLPLSIAEGRCLGRQLKIVF